MFLDIPILIQARTGSKRFPQKVIKELDGHSLVWRTYKNCLAASNNVFVIGIKQDYTLFNHCKEQGIKMIGLDVPENDLIQRYAAACMQIGAQGFIRVTADCPFIFPQEILWIGMNALKYKNDFITNGWPGVRSTPDGVDCEYYSFNLISWMMNNVKAEIYREHLPLYLYEKWNGDENSDKRLDIFTKVFTGWPINMSKVKFSIDTEIEFEKILKGDIYGNVE